MQIALTVDSSQLQAWSLLAEKKLAYACARAINATAKQVQQDVRAHVREKFTLRPRTAEFVLRQAAVIKPWASAAQGRPFADVSVGQKPRLLLPGFEEGAVRTPFKGKRVAVPVVGSPARPTWGASVPEPFTFRGMRLKKVIPRQGTWKRRVVRGRRVNLDFSSHVTSTGRVQFKGSHRTFLLPHTRTGMGMILQRYGPRRGDTLMIYSFVEPFELPAQLGFMHIAQTRGQQYFRQEMQRQLEDALGHEAARGRL